MKFNADFAGRERVLFSVDGRKVLADGVKICTAVSFEHANRIRSALHAQESQLLARAGRRRREKLPPDQRDWRE